MEPQQRQSGRRGVINTEIVLISIFAQASTITLLLLPNNCAQGKASMRPVIIRLKNIISGQIDLIKVAGAPVPMHGVSCLKHGAFGHVPEAVKWKGLTCYLQSILAYSVKPTSPGVIRQGWGIAGCLSGGIGSMLPLRVSGKGWQ